MEGVAHAPNIGVLCRQISIFTDTVATALTVQVQLHGYGRVARAPHIGNFSCPRSIFTDMEEWRMRHTSGFSAHPLSNFTDTVAMVLP
ncbi:hypothetical protein D3C77_725380 [compost metagenome]